MTTHRPHIGIILMIVSTVSIAAGWVGVKLLGERLPTSEIVFFRSLVGIIILIPIALYRTGSINGHNKKLLLARGIFGLIGMQMAFFAMTKMNLGDAAILLNTFPLFVALLAPFFLKERSNPGTFFLVVLAFVGVAFILKPTWDIFTGVALMGLAAGLMVAFAMMIVRKLHETESTWTIATWFSLIIVIGIAPLMAFQFIAPTVREIVIMLLMGSLLTLSQIFLTKAYRYAEASLIAPFAYLSVLWSYGFDILLWRHVPDLWSAIGSAIVIGSGVGIIILSRRPLVRAGATS